MQSFNTGARVRLTETFTDLITGLAADPTTIALKLRDPSGVETVYTYAAAQVVRDAVGVYHFDVTLALPGQWVARWVAGGVLVAADEILFRVTASAFASP